MLGRRLTVRSLKRSLIPSLRRVRPAPMGIEPPPNIRDGVPVERLAKAMRFVANMRRRQYVVRRPERVRRRQVLNVEYVESRSIGRPVSHPRASNWTSPFQASGFPTGCNLLCSSWRTSAQGAPFRRPSSSPFCLIRRTLFDDGLYPMYLRPPRGLRCGPNVYPRKSSRSCRAFRIARLFVQSQFQPPQHPTPPLQRLLFRLAATENHEVRRLPHSACPVAR